MKALPPQTEYVLVKGAGHFSFVASFPKVLRIVAGETARDPEGFDRDAMHEAMNPEVVSFFDRKLRSGAPPTPLRGSGDAKGGFYLKQGDKEVARIDDCSKGHYLALMKKRL